MKFVKRLSHFLTHETPDWRKEVGLPKAGRRASGAGAPEFKLPKLLTLMLLGASVSLSSLGSSSAQTAQLFVSNFDANTVSEYNNLTGELINSTFVTGLSGPRGLAFWGE